MFSTVRLSECELALLEDCSIVYKITKLIVSTVYSKVYEKEHWPRFQAMFTESKVLFQELGGRIVGKRLILRKYF